MTLIRWNPRRELSTFQNQMNRLFDDFWGEHSPATSDAISGNWTPSVDVLEEKDLYKIAVALPGMDQKDIKVGIENNTLNISGERRFENEEKRDKYTRVEQFYGSFNRSFTLPNTIDVGKVEAAMDKGVLHITLPKREESKPKQVEIKVK